MNSSFFAILPPDFAGRPLACYARGMSLPRKIACTIAAVALIYLAYVFSVLGFRPDGVMSGRFVAGAGFCGFLGLYLLYDAWGRTLVGRGHRF